MTSTTRSSTSPSPTRSTGGPAGRPGRGAGGRGEDRHRPLPLRALRGGEGPDRRAPLLGRDGPDHRVLPAVPGALAARARPLDRGARPPPRLPARLGPPPRPGSPLGGRSAPVTDEDAATVAALERTSPAAVLVRADWEERAGVP